MQLATYFFKYQSKMVHFNILFTMKIYQGEALHNGNAILLPSAYMKRSAPYSIDVYILYEEEQEQ